MTFVSLKEQQATRKFELVRLNPARDITSLIVSIGGGRYTYTSSLWINRVQLMGIEMTKVTGTPAIGEFSFDDFTQILTIYPSSAPTSVNPLVAFHYLFYTGEVYRSWYEDPEDISTPLREWLPRLGTSPRVSQGITDILAGNLSIATTNVDIINNDWDLNDYFTVNDSFYQKEIQLWLCLDNETNIQKIFSGTIVSATLDRDQLSLDIKDNFQLLNSPCLLGDSSGEAYYQIDSTPTLDPNRNGEPRNFITGTCSKYKTLNTTLPTLPNAQRLDPESLPFAACLTFNRELLVTNNRTWGICRTAFDGFQDFTHTVLSVDNTDPDFTKFTSSLLDANRMYIGDTFVMTISLVDYYGRVYYVDRLSGDIYTTKIAAAFGTPTISGNNCPSIVILQNTVTHYLQCGRDYSAVVTPTSGGNKQLDIIFVDDFETPLGMTPLDPSLDTVSYRVRPSILKHGAMIKYIFDKIGIVNNAASFTTADTDYPLNVNFSIPTLFESDYDSNLKYVQDILSSTFGYIYLNNAFEFQYRLFSNPSSIDVITDAEILKDSFAIKIEYQDIITQIVAYNPHASSEEFISTASYTLKNIKAGYLHGFFNTTRFVHCLEDITTRLQTILDYRSNRAATYQFETAVKNLDTQLGDDFLMDKLGLLDGTSKQVKIISLDKYTLKTVVTATDLGV